MAEYVYPAVFLAEKEGGYSITFPDLKGCFTCGDTLEDGLYMAGDALSFMLVNLEDEQKDIPVSSTEKEIDIKSNEFIKMISADTAAYRRKHLHMV